MNLNFKINILPFALIDVLFLPYIRPLPITLSLIPVLIWNFKKIHINLKKKDIALLYIVIFYAIFSFLYSAIVLPNIVLFDGAYINPIINNTILLGIFMIFFCYLFLFRQNFYRYTETVYTILEIYLYFNLVLAIIYWFDYLTYFEVRGFWTFRGSSLSVGEFTSITRFTGIFSDPNNAAVASVMIYATLFSNLYNIKKFILYSLMIAFIIISTMSTTGVIVFIISFCSLLMFQIYKSKKSIYTYLILFCSIPIICFLTLKVSDTFIYSIFMDRMTTNDGGGRLGKVVTYLCSEDFLHTFIIGSGGTIFINGEGNKPHIGHLHLIFNYSFYSWIIFIYVIFRPRIKKIMIQYLPILIFLLGFTINTGIIDFRFAVIASLIVGIYMNENKTNEMNEKVFIERSGELY